MAASWLRRAGSVRRLAVPRDQAGGLESVPILEEEDK
jgi:hypothetical protein